MTSPGGFLRDITGGALRPSGRSSAPGRGGTAPSNRSNPGYTGSADRMERQAEHDPDWHTKRYGEPTQASGYGDTLWDVLDMPENFGMGTQVFNMDIALPGEDGAYSFTDAYGNPVSGTNVVEMSVKAGVEWLRKLSLKDKDGYNSLVMQLWQSGYLDESDVRLNSFSSTVAQAFAEAAFDVATMNAGEDGGAVVTLWDHLTALADGAAESGFGPGGSGGSGRQAPVREDQRLADEDLKKGIHDQARDLLGRALTPDEEKLIGGLYRSRENQWNGERFNAQMADFEGRAHTAPSELNPGTSIDAGIREQFATEKGAQDLASFVGVMGNMMGLGLGGMTDLE